MEVAEVNLREESQLENLHDHLQNDKEQGKEQEPQENSKEPIEQNQLHSFQNIKFVLGQMKVTSPSLQKQQKR